MNILFVDQFGEMGGAQCVLVDTVDAAIDQGWSAQAALPSGGPLRHHLRARNIAAYDIPCGPYKQGTKSMQDITRFAFDLKGQVQVLRSLLDRSHFDLLYVNGPRVLTAASLANRGRMPVLFHVHYPIHQASAARLVRWNFRRSNVAAVGCCQSVLESIGNSTRSGKLHVVENGVAEIGFREHRFGERGWRIGLVGRISQQKGQLDFVKAASIVASEWPTTRFQICGAPLFGEDEYSELVQKSARGLPVDFLGWREDIASVLGDLDMLMMPSQDEGLPRALLEAFSAGVPVIAFPVGGITEAITDGETGFLTAGKSPEALATRIIEAIASGPDALRRVALSARRSWERTYTLARYQQRITRLMSSLVSGSRAEREIEVLPLRK